MKPCRSTIPKISFIICYQAWIVAHSHGGVATGDWLFNQADSMRHADTMRYHYEVLHQLCCRPRQAAMAPSSAKATYIALQDETT